jgi:hypothetical protein
MGFLRDFALNIPERQLNILWGRSHKPQRLLGAANYLTNDIASRRLQFHTFN